MNPACRVTLIGAILTGALAMCGLTKAGPRSGDPLG